MRVVSGSYASFVRRRISPSWAVDATSVPSRVKNCPRTRPRAPDADGLSIVCKSQSSIRKWRWNHIVWSMLATCIRGSIQVAR